MISRRLSPERPVAERSHDTRSPDARRPEPDAGDRRVASPPTPAAAPRNGRDGARADAQRRLVESLVARLSAPVRLLETHISFVLLTGAFAYKIKKAVRLPFLDFSTLARRRKFCDEELRLNRRLAPDLYLDVVPITGTPDAPAIGGDGPALEYAVRMREFRQEDLLSNVLERGALTPAHIDALAERLARFHAAAAVSAPGATHGTPMHARALALANFREIARLPESAAERRALQSLRQWTRDEHTKIRATLEERLRRGAVRECHGDLHLGNVALIDGVVTIFDCLEFNAGMRWMDTMSEVAFAVMDLVHRDQAALAHRLLTAYCERSGDYGGVAVLRFHLVYRAMVRAKVAALRAAQLTDSRARAACAEEFAAHLRLASRLATDVHPAFVVMHGLSGSGKTTLSQMLLERAGAVRVRTDVERKRLAGLAATQASGSSVAGCH
jgi:aminoglycoside phosphotransferase family enzyme